MCGRSFAMRLVVNSWLVRIGKGAESHDVAGQSIGEQTCSVSCETACTRPPVTAVDDVAVATVLKLRIVDLFGPADF